MLSDGIVNGFAGVFRAHGEHSGELQATEKANGTVVTGTTVFLNACLRLTVGLRLSRSWPLRKNAPGDSGLLQPCGAS
jgi:hypothetical protein